MASSKQARAQAALVKQTFWTPTRVGLTAAVFVLIALVLTTFIPKKDEASPALAPGAPRATRPMGRPSALTELPAGAMQANIDLLDGNQTNLSSYAGKVVVLDLWATWCGPCRVEIPYLVELAREFKSKGVEVIGLTTEDKNSDEAAVREFTKQFKINYQIGWANRELALGILGGRGSIPQTLVFGRDGKIRRHLIGFNARISPPQLRAAVEQAVAE